VTYTLENLLYFRRIILTRWISPDSAGAVDGLNLYVYVGNNPLKYIDPTGNDEIGTISWNVFVTHMNTRQKHGDRLNLWVGEDHLPTRAI
jgi:hypothetical protein